MMPPLWTTAAAVATAVTSGLGLHAWLRSTLARRRAPRALASVREALARRDPDEARRLLPSAFHVPLSGRYRPEDAAVALAALNAFEETMGTYRLNAAAVTRDLREALEHCGRRGTRVPWRLIGPVLNVLARVAVADAPLKKVLRHATLRAARARREWQNDADAAPLMVEVLPSLAPVGGGEARATAPLDSPRGARGLSPRRWRLTG
jgi:hypothetical protein